jgi:hypothetical protein
MKTADLLANLQVGEAYYVAIRRPLQPKTVGSVVRFVKYLGKSPAERGQGFWFEFVDYNCTSILKPECIVRIGKTPMLDGPEAVT